MGPTHTIIDVIDGEWALLAPLAITTTFPPLRVALCQLETYEPDPDTEHKIGPGVMAARYKRSDMAPRPWVSVRVLSPLEALARADREQ